MAVYSLYGVQFSSQNLIYDPERPQTAQFSSRIQIEEFGFRTTIQAVADP
jgi:hypothetical protein